MPSSSLSNIFDMGLPVDAVDLGPALIDGEFQAKDVLVKAHRGRQITVVLEGDRQNDSALRSSHLHAAPIVFPFGIQMVYIGNAESSAFDATPLNEAAK